MQVNDILKNLDSLLHQHYPPEQIPARRIIIGKLLDERKEAIAEIKALSKKKQATSKRFKSTPASESNALKQVMQSVSTELKAAKKRKQEIESDIISALPQTNPVPAPPEHMGFTPEASVDNSHCSEINISIKTTRLSADESNYISKHKGASIYHSGDWLNLINKYFQHSSVAVIAHYENGQISGILPITEIRSRLFGHYALSLPYVNYGGPLADSTQIEQALLNAAAEFCMNKGLAHLEIRATRKLNDWQVKKEKVSMVLALPASQELLDKQLGSKLRSQIKQSRNHGLKPVIGGIELLEDFYRVFATNMRDLGTPVYSKTFFLEILKAFPEHSSIVVLLKENVPVSAAFLLGHRETLEIPWASTIRSANKMSANMLLYREVLGLAIDKKYSYFDFGRSSIGAPTYRFKKQWGAQPVQHYWHYWLSKGEELPQLNPENPKYKLAITLWKKLPLWLTRIIGPSIVKNLP